MKKFNAYKVLQQPFVDLPWICAEMKNKQDVRKLLEEISKRAGMMAAYIDQREGFGCGDQGHDKALKEMNKVGKIIWMKAFGYNGYYDLYF